MNTTRRKALAVVGLMVGSTAAAEWWRPTQRLAASREPIVLETLFPKQFGPWQLDTRGPVQLVAPDAQAVIDKIYGQTLSRVYLDGRGGRVMLSVAYGGDQSDGTRAHRPEVCYPAQGFQILRSETVPITLASHRLNVRRLLAVQGNRSEPITYWTTVGTRTAISGTEQKLAQLAYTTRGVIPDGMLVRVSTIDRDLPRAFDLQAQFLHDMATAVAETQRDLVLGSVRG